MIVNIAKLLCLVMGALGVAGCFDVVHYTVRGTISSTALNHGVKEISGVKVTMKCPSIAPRPNKATSDDSGSYILRGTGVPVDCELMFEHRGFSPATVKIAKEKHLKYDQDILSPIYEINIDLGPQSSK
jgi:hypothetical protein